MKPRLFFAVAKRQESAEAAYFDAQHERNLRRLDQTTHFIFQYPQSAHPDRRYID